MQPVFIQPAPKVVLYNSRASYVLGVLGIIFGILCIITNLVIISLYYYIRLEASIGVLGGIFFIITGSIGLGAARNGNGCLVISFMVLSIITASLLVPVMLALNGLHISHIFHYKYMHHQERALPALLIFFALVELVISIVSAAICCRAVCCGVYRPLQQQENSAFMQTPTGSQVILVPHGENIQPMHPHGGNIQPMGQQFVLQPATPQYLVQPQDGMAVATPSLAQYGSVEEAGATQKDITGPGQNATEEEKQQV